MFATISGKVVEFECNGCIAVVETKRGRAYVDIDTDFPLRLEIGDEVEFDNTGCSIIDGTPMHIVNEETLIFINDWGIKFKERIG